MLHFKNLSSGVSHWTHKFYFACIVRCIGLYHYYQSRLQSWFSSGWKQFIGNRPLNVCVHGLAISPGSMSPENMIRNTLLGNEGSTPRAKGMQAVSGSKICEGHVSRISQSLQNASSSKGVRPGLICGAKIFRITLPAVLRSTAACLATFTLN